MLFSSPVFLFCFLPFVLTGYYVFLRGLRRGQNLLLLVCSLFFYGWGEPRFLLVMLGSILMNYGFGRWVYRQRFRGKHKTLPVAAAVVCNLALLFVFKYLGFAVMLISKGHLIKRHTMFLRSQVV